MDRCPEMSAVPSASSRVDSNTSRSVWSNLYLVWSVNIFGHYSYVEGYQLKVLWVGDRWPGHHLFEIGCHVLLNLVI